MTERDDFLREHLSPPADSDDQPSGRPPETPPPAEQDDTPPRIALDDPQRPTGPDNDGRARRRTPSAGHPRNRGDRPGPTIESGASRGRQTGSTPDRSAYRRAARGRGLHPRKLGAHPRAGAIKVPPVVPKAGPGKPPLRSPPG